MTVWYSDKTSTAALTDDNSWLANAKNNLADDNELIETIS